MNWSLLKGTRSNDPLKLKGRRRVVRAMAPILLGASLLCARVVCESHGAEHRTVIETWRKVDDKKSDIVILSVTAFLVSPTGSNQTYNVPNDWDSANNTISTIGAGASGSIGQQGTDGGSGGGGGGYSSQSNITLTPGGTATYQIGTGGASVTRTNNGTRLTGNAGGDTWFNGTTLGGSTVGAKGGTSRPSPLGGLGGEQVGNTGGVGATKRLGGNGGFGGDACIGNGNAGGGGGAAGNTANGTNGVDGNGTQGNGGAGGATGGGAGGSGAGANGSAGTNFDATHGAGGGGAGSLIAGTAGAGGLYGAGGGGTPNSGSGTFTSGAGAQGLIVIVYTPAVGASVRNRGFIIG